MESINNEEPLTIKELNNAVKTQKKKKKKNPGPDTIPQWNLHQSNNTSETSLHKNV